ncbi:MAG: hypothetical protein V4674_04055 [Patescibacteria group bacterium]
MLVTKWFFGVLVFLYLYKAVETCGLLSWMFIASLFACIVAYTEHGKPGSHIFRVLFFGLLIVVLGGAFWPLLYYNNKKLFDMAMDAM